jgi:hypothetical protein
MPLPTRFKGVARILALASTVLLGLTGALAAFNPGAMRMPASWKFAKPALKIAKDTLRQRRITRPDAKPWLKTSPGPPDTRKVNPGPPGTRKVNPSLPAVQINPGPPNRR